MKSIAILKNGYDVLRIIEGASDGNKCDFKIVPMVESKDLNFFVMQMFSKPLLINLENTERIEITYHKATENKSTKIHLKLIDENGNKKYQTLPLKRLIDPDVNTPIPIPLFKMLIPDGVLKRKYKKKSSHVAFDIEDNNVIEFFMTKNGFDFNNLFTNWSKVTTMLLGNCMQYFTNGCNYFVGYNIGAALNKCRITGVPVIASKKADITEDIGLLINTLQDPFIRANKMEFLFIENEFYLPLCAGTLIKEVDNDLMPAYQCDILNTSKHNRDDQEKMIKLFEKSFIKYNKFIRDNQQKYNEITKHYKQKLLKDNNKIDINE